MLLDVIGLLMMPFRTIFALRLPKRLIWMEQFKYVSLFPISLVMTFMDGLKSLIDILIQNGKVKHSLTNQS